MNTSSIIEAMTCGPKVAAYTSPTPSMPHAVLQLQEHEIAAAEARRRIAHHEYFDAVEFHPDPSLSRFTRR